MGAIQKAIKKGNAAIKDLKAAVEEKSVGKTDRKARAAIKDLRKGGFSEIADQLEDKEINHTAAISAIRSRMKMLNVTSKKGSSEEID